MAPATPAMQTPAMQTNDPIGQNLNRAFSAMSTRPPQDLVKYQTQFNNQMQQLLKGKNPAAARIGALKTFQNSSSTLNTQTSV
jgi:hypothetical protein